MSENINAIKDLKEMGIEFTAENFVLGAGNGNIAATKLFLDGGMNSDTLHAGWTALLQAIAKKQFDIAQFLIDNGADVNMKEETNGMNALMWCAQNGNLEITKKVIAKGTDINLEHPKFGRPIQIAKAHTNNDIYEFLIQQGAIPPPTFFENFKTEFSFGKEKKTSTILLIASIIVFAVASVIYHNKIVGDYFGILLSGALIAAIMKLPAVGAKSSFARLFKVSCIVFLLIGTLFSPMDFDSHGSSSSGGSSSGSSGTNKCMQCGGSYSGSGWSTVGGEQFQPTSGDGGYCSKSCAYNSQPAKWKR